MWLPYAPEVLTQASVRLAEETGTALFRMWVPAAAGPPGISCTEVTVAESGLGWTAADVKAALGGFLERVTEQDQLARKQ